MDKKLYLYNIINTKLVKTIFENLIYLVKRTYLQTKNYWKTENLLASNSYKQKESSILTYCDRGSEERISTTKIKERTFQMKRTKTKRALQVLTLVLLSALLYCCTDEQSFSGPGNGDEKTIVFSVKVPGNSTPKTRALLGDDENAVKQIAVLLFDEKGYTYHPIYSNTITDTGNGKKSFTLKVPEGTFNMVILANANASLSNALNGVKEGMSKTELLKKITVTNQEKWNTDTNQANYMPIPMWGEIPTITVNSNTKNIDTSLLRMLSKIDVSLAQAAQANFDLQSIRLYNYNTVGQVVPDATNWDSDANAVKSPSIQGSTTAGPLVYEGDAIKKDNEKGVSCKDEIYAFEAAAGDPANLKTNTCLVIGGVYKGDNKPTYYRVDIANTKSDGTSTFLALLRNFQYQISIQSVSGSGVDTPGEALEARPVNITANVIKWSNSQFTEFAINDQYLVGVSQAEFTFSKETRDASSIDNLLSVVTDYPKGWHIDITDADGNLLGESSWLSCDPPKGTNIEGDNVRLLMGDNNTEAERVAYIHVKAERLDYRIKVTQLNTANVGIHILVDGKEDNIIEFISTVDEIKAKTLPNPKLIKLIWSPASENIMCNSSIIGSNKIEFNTGDNLQELPGTGQLSSNNGKLQYNIQPKLISEDDINNNAFYQRSTVYFYTLTDGITTLNKTLTLRQTVYNVVPELPSTFLMDGQQKSFGIRANTDFKVEVTDDPHHIVSNLKTSGAPDVSKNGTPVTFTIKDDLTNPSLYQEKVTLTIKSPTGKFPDTPITLNCVSGIVQDPSNSYIMQTNGTGILIPVSRANDSPDLGKQLGDNEAYTSELLWTDNVNGIANGSNVKMIQTAGAGTKGYVLVLPGSSEGNAVIAIRNSNKDILWSWHVWTVGSTPKVSETGFMDRFLGATGDLSSAATMKCPGLRYQWGRKDPFPPAGNLTSIYNASGGQAKIAKQTAMFSIQSAVRAPLCFIVNNDWVSPTNTGLWQESTKTVYDPCPSGWRVPENIQKWNLAIANWTRVMNTNEVSSSINGGCYPANGRLTDPDVAASEQKYGFVWVSQFANIAGGTQSIALIYNTTSSDYWPPRQATHLRGHAEPVRCIKEQK